MLDAMVAATGFDLIVAMAWVGGVTVFLLGRAVASWVRFRRTSNFAVYARLLSEATGSPAPGQGDASPGAEIVPFPQPPLPGERSAS